MKKIFLILIVTLVAACSTSTLPNTEQPSWNADRIVNALDKSNKKIADSSNRYQIRLERISKLLKSVSSREVYIDSKVDLFILGSHLRMYSGVMDIMRDDELLSLMAQEEAHNKLGHYKNFLENVSDGYEQALDTPFSDTQNSAADAYALNFFIENKQDPQAVVNAAYKLAKIEEKNSLLGAEISASPRLINKSSRDRAKAVASMLQEAKQNPQYLAGLIQNEASTPVPAQETKTISQPEVKKEKVEPVKTVKKEITAKKEVIEPVEEIQELEEDPFMPEPVPAFGDEDKIEDKTMVEKKAVQGTKSASIQSVKKEAPVETSVGIAKGWYLQVSAEDNKQAAATKVQNLSESQLRGAVQETSVSGKKFYRVLIGPYASKAELAETKKSSHVSSEAFARYVD